MHTHVAIARWHVVRAAGARSSIHLSLAERWYVQIISSEWIIAMPVPFRVETVDLHLGSEDCTISCYPLRMHLGSFRLFLQLQLYYALLLRMHSSGLLILLLGVVSISSFLWIFVIFLDKITSKAYEACAVNTFAFDFLCSFIFLFRVVISTNLMN